MANGDATRVRTHWALVALMAVSVLGCDETAIPPEPAPPAPLGAAFDARSTGSIFGQVVWEGDIPRVSPFRAYANRSFPTANQFVGEKPNPHAPQIEPQARGLRHAAVYLKEVDLARSRAWNHGKVRVAVQQRELQVQQGDEPGMIGFVRQGDAVEFVNAETRYHLLKGRGAAFFSLPFVQPNQPTRQILQQPGIVELTAGAGQFWMQGYLFVSSHPYFTLSDAGGRFTLEDVPPGDYELVAWLPNWNIERLERDPEVGLVSRVVYKPALVQVQRVRVAPGQRTEASFHCASAQFDNPD